MSETASEFEREATFEAHIRTRIAEIGEDSQSDLAVLVAKKVADIVVVSKKDAGFCKFIEVKYHKKSSGRIGIGQKDGSGFQPEILKTQSGFFENNLLWILGSEIFPGKRWILTNSQINKYISGGELGRKYNNLQNILFKEIEPYSDEGMVKFLAIWLGAKKYN